MKWFDNLTSKQKYWLYVIIIIISIITLTVVIVVIIVIIIAIINYNKTETKEKQKQYPLNITMIKKSDNNIQLYKINNVKYELNFNSINDKQNFDSLIKKHIYKHAEILYNIRNKITNGEQIIKKILTPYVIGVFERSEELYKTTGYTPKYLEL